MLRLFEQREGLRIELTVHPKLNRYGNIKEDYPLVMVQRVERDEFDGAIGGLHMHSAEHGNISYTYPLLLDNKVYVLPRAHSLGQWEALLHSAYYTCLVFGVLFICLCTAATFLTIFPSLKRNAFRDILLVLGYMLNKTSVKNIHTGLPQRMTATCLFFFGFIMPYIVQAFLYSFYSNPVLDYEPKDLKSMTGFKLILYTEFIKDGVPYERHCGSKLNCLYEVKYSDDKLYTIMSSADYDIYHEKLADENGFSGVYLLQEPYKVLLRTVILRKGSILFNRFNDFIFRIAANGLMKKYAWDSYVKNRLHCRSRPTRHHQQSKFVPLKLTDFYGTFVILIVGQCLAFLVFIYELLVSARRSTS
ncbi:uncharacterized protein LOC142981276 [Anticarsia gemmatalis]|uniref:uncharacterized protein LOC142981276 n=1 Tax=Anticarsia gemmatalis TaxID=129554 RepID=UPI003F774344